jgi:RecB family exonuclease
MSVRVVWSTVEWARAIADEPREGLLPALTVLVPRSAVAHALRKELVRLDRRDTLGGTLFVSPVAAAAEVLHNGGIPFTEGEEGFRAARIRSLFRSGLTLRYFDLPLLRDAEGWEAAFARTIGELEGAGVSPEELERAATRATGTDAARLWDVAAIWRAASEAAGASWSRARICREAASVLAGKPDVWPYPGSTIAAVTGHEDAVEGRLLRAIPGVRLVVLGARPMREAHLARCGVTLGGPVEAALREARVTRRTDSERALLQSYLFETGDALNEKRPRSSGPDGTVHLEEHAGIDEELEAAAAWVSRLVFEQRTPLEEIALLLAQPDPFAAMLVDRLERRGIAAHVSGGLPACTTAAGARALAVVRALESHLHFERLAEVLPTLRLASEDGEPAAASEGPRHLRRGEARELAFGLGTVGGNHGNPSGALEWTARLRARREALEREIRDADADREDDDPRERERRVRRLSNVRGIEPALVALVDLARHGIGNTELRALAPRLAAFLSGWLLAPGEGRAVLASLADRLASLAADASCGALRGDDALGAIEDCLLTQRVPVGRFGDASVHIDTVVRAAGLPFQAVRLLGLSEGSLPSPLREDAVLPERVRAVLGAPALGNDRSTAQLHAVDRLVRDARGVAVLSAPRMGVDRTYREPSSLFIEAATALGRPNACSGKHEAIVPDGRALRRDAFLPARTDATAFRRGTPLAEAEWHDRVARAAEHGAIDPGDRRIVPARWNGEPHQDLSRIAELRAKVGGPNDGLLGDAARLLRLPGLSADRPLSASALATLLGCPHKFLFERGFGWREPAEAPGARELDALSYGTLFHSVAEEFFVTHGAKFGEREGTVATWYPLAEKIADEAFEQYLEQYPLTGEAVRDVQRERLRDDVRALLEHEHGEPKASFVAAERKFGGDEPLAWPTSGGPIYLVGYIDRIDLVAKTTRVRDLKTGKAHPRRADSPPEADRDVQVALYALVASELAGAWGVPARVSAQYLYASARGVALRDWDGEMGALLKSGKEWLELASALLRAGDLPRTPAESDCTYCSFQAVCGEGRNARAAQVLAKTGRLHALMSLKEEE